MNNYPLLQSQEGIFLECLYDPNSTRYNLPVVVTLPKSIDLDRMEQGLLLITRARKEMRLRFMTDENGEPRQWVDDDMQFEVARLQLGDDNVEQYMHTTYIRPFDILSGEPLWRFALAEGNKNNYFLVDCHHLVSDGMTLGLCFAILDLPASYEGQLPEFGAYGMLEHALDEQAAFGSDAYQKAKEYYREKCADVELATILPVPTTHVGKLIRDSFFIDTNEVDEWCKAHGTSANLLFMAAFSYVLSESVREEKVAYYTINHGRIDKRLRNGAYGMFVKSVPICANVARSQNVLDFVKSFKSELFNSVRYGVYPFTHFCRDLKKKPGVEFGFQGASIQEVCTIDGHPLDVKQIASGLSASNMSCIIYISGSNYEIRMSSSEAINPHSVLQAVGKAVLGTVRSMMSHPDGLLSEISMLTDEDRQRVERLHVSATAEVSPQLFYQPIEHYAATTPDTVALVAKDRSLTYAAFNTEANRIAHALIRRGVKRGDRVVLLLPRTSAVIVSMFGVSKTGAAYIPCDPEYPADRINLIMTDSEAQYVITTKAHAADYPPEKVIDINDIYHTGHHPDSDGENPHVEVSPDDLAYLIYTSGSTGRPKGVMLRHEGITNYLFNHPANVHIDGLKRLGVRTFVSITTLSFDMSLKEFAGALLNGLTAVLADEQEVLDPLLLAALMNRVDADVINGTCSRIQSYMEQPEFCDALRRCRMVWSGGEMYPQALLRSLQSLGVEVINTYGPTEITVSSNIKNLTHSDRVTVGRPLLNYIEFVVDPWGNELPVGFTGELLIGGPGVARGYNHMPELTAERFVEYQGVRVYRSGDLARWTDDGDLEILGRMDSQVKLRGFRIELEEIETKALQFDGVRKAVADVRNIGATQHLCLYYTSDRALDNGALQSFLMQSLTDYMVPTVFMRIDEVPLTPNGKTNRKALPEPVLSLEEIVEPSTAKERAVFGVVSRLLQLNDFGVTNNLVSLGLTSLLAMRLSAMLQKELGMNIRMHEILLSPTVRDMIASASESVTRYEPHPLQSTYPISESQRGMYIDCIMNPKALQYNIPFVVHFEDADPQRIVDAFRKVVDAHPYMKVRLVMKDGDLVQVRNDSEPLAPLSVERLTEMPDRAFFQRQVKPFDITGERLYRIHVYACANHVFVFTDLHHLIADGSSNAVLARDMERAYNGLPLEKETYTAYDRALDEQAFMQGSRAKEAEAYFDNMLTGLSSTVYPHSSKRDPGSHREGSIDLPLDGEAINAFCRKNALLHNGFFMAVLNQVLHRLTREDDVLTYFISNGRSELQLENFFGVFVKTMPCVCSQWTGTMVELSREMNRQMQETIKNDFYPFTTMVERHGLKADIIFNYVANFEHDVVLEGRKQLERYTLDWDTAKNPLSLSIFGDADGNYVVNIEYDADLYSRDDMTRLAKAYVHLAQESVRPENTGCDVSRMALLDAADASQVIALSTGDRLELRSEETFVSMFLQSAKATPDAPAVVDEQGAYTYAELDALSGALAARLRQQGVGAAAGTRSPFVSIMLGYQKDFLVAAIGVERAGGAYVPLDYDYPNDRLRYMLDDSESQVLITSHAIYSEKTSHGDSFTAGSLLFIDDLLTPAPSPITHAPSTINHATPDGIAYMIYTSGSTGKPKGVMISHRAKAHFVQFIAHQWRLTGKSRISCHSSFSFDASIEDLYPVLTVGGALYIVPQAARKDMSLLHQFIVDNGITGGCYTTQLGIMLLQQYPDLPVDYLVVGGEKMSVSPDCQCRLINTYGPTEFTVDATFFELERGRTYKNIPIGRPLHNLSAFVVDQYGQLVPQGVAGELCMAGPQMASGYWKQAQLTREKFTDSPFFRGTMYHTGDLVRYNDQRQIEYLGRIDTQVKLRGFRIELGEIESLIAAYPGIQMESVQVREIGGVQHLCAYYSADAPIDAAALRAYLSEALTDYMVPTAYMQLDAMPLTPNGKVNTKALPLPEVTAEETVSPETETEKILFDVAVELLKHDQFGVTTNLISMGLTSLSAMRLSALLQQKMEVVVPVTDLMADPTIRKIAQYIDCHKAKPSPKTDMFTKRATPNTHHPTSNTQNPFAAKKANPFNKK